MNAKIIGGIIVVIAVVLGAYFLMGRKSNQSAEQHDNTAQTGQSSSQQSTTTETASTGPRSLQDLIGLGSSQKCTFKDAENEGTVYAASGKVRIDASNTKSGKTTKSHIIVDNTTSYTWVEGQSTGFKMTIDPKTGEAVDSSMSAQQTMDPSKKIDYSCSSWSVDQSIFAPPSNVNFMSLGDIKIPGQ